VNAIEFTKEKRHATIASLCKKPPDFQMGSNYYLVWASFGNAYSFAKEKSPPIFRRALIAILFGPALAMLTALPKRTYTFTFKVL
jgi:hypothetical protein